MFVVLGIDHSSGSLGRFTWHALLVSAVGAFRDGVGLSTHARG